LALRLGAPSSLGGIPGRHRRSSPACRELLPLLLEGRHLLGVSTSDNQGPLPCMRIDAFLHPTVLLALADGASFLEHRDRPSAQCPYRRPSFTRYQH
jgi:hypothetical protein